jgi:hypothetical protein
MGKTFKTTDLTEFGKMLREGIVEFEFIKKDGSVRSAKGTLVAEHLPAPKADSDGTSRKPNENVMVYFDMEKQSFRSFVKESFVGAY